MSLIVILGAATATVWFSADRAIERGQTDLVNSQAVAVGKSIANQVAATRSRYAKDIVSQLKPQGVKFSTTPGEGEAPLPATFVTHVSSTMKESAGEHGASFVLRSGWNINRDQGLSTEFEKRGWQSLLDQQESMLGGETPFEPYWERGVTDHGIEVVRVMTADLASAKSCVECHNKLEKTAEIRARRGDELVKTFELNDLMGAVVTTVPVTESAAMVDQLSNTRARYGWLMALVTIGGCLTAGVVSVLVSRRFFKPVSDSIEVLGEIAKGDLTRRVSVTGNDEVARLGESINELASKLQSIIVNIRGNTETLSGSSAGLAGTSTELATLADDATTRTRTVSAAAEEMSLNMKTMAQSTEEVSNKINEVAGAVTNVTESIGNVANNAEQSAAIASEAAELVRESDSKIANLGESAKEIGNVVSVIQDIAEQTNLLALNATIEAARAGDAGKGFAVVATEVKELAKQTAAATEDIRRRIEGMQGSTTEAVASIKRISEVIANVNKVANAIASAVETQNSTTKQISVSISDTAAASRVVSSGVLQSAHASEEITQNIVQVDQVLRQTAAGASQSKEAGEEFSDMAKHLQGSVAQFQIDDESQQAL
ncbi:MAG: methyl-accepting chemotaxis protein [Pirellulaceae bacterium]|nr:methyl-accepting chemotaxis protein [Pirellulaceae bacterium]